MPRSEAQKELSRRLSREAKRRRRGKCRLCGDETRYHGHRIAVSDMCVGCANTARGRRMRGEGTRQQQLRDVLADGNLRFTEIAERMGISRNHACALIYPELQAGRIRRIRRGLYALPDGPE